MNRTEQIQETARDLLEREKVNCVIGYEPGSRGHARPAFIYKAEDVERLTWDETCTHNLVRYLLKREDEYLAIVVKPCDARAINVMLAENKLFREHIYIMGVKCEGVKVHGNLQDRCQRCTQRTPVIYDKLIDGEPATISYDTPVGEIAYKQIESLSPKEKMEFWLEQFDQCIRCYACRQACPICSCPTCLYERDDSHWVGIGIGVSEKRAFHLGRAFHLAGRCVGCNECQRVCPVDLPISMLNQKIHQEMQNLFNYTPGLSQTISPLTTVLSPEEVLP
ncbi:MAG: 4Fe-4S dicluster domain-containing protein [Anaerolineales bacterium]|nr:4Fe-4S dicluster domain-containing protein [Anaerolineales bacterium]